MKKDALDPTLNERYADFVQAVARSMTTMQDVANMIDNLRAMLKPDPDKQQANPAPKETPADE